jgi:hypothetical protein
MVPFDIGGFVSWKLYPSVKVIMDSRLEVAYQYESVVENVNFYTGDKGCQNIPLKYETDAILVPNWAKVKKEIERDIYEPDKFSTQKTWMQVYTEPAYSIFMEPKIAAEYPRVDLGQMTIKVVFS